MPDPKARALLVKSLRIVGTIVGALALLFLLLLSVHQAFLPFLATCFPSLERPFYDLAVYGIYRAHEYVSFPYRSPNVNIVRWDNACDDGNVFLGPYGDSVGVPGPTILDSRGELVWFTDEFDQVTNFQMQEHQGRNYLTFWAGHKVGGVGRGALYMLDETYKVARKVHAVGDDLKGDLHEFQITRDGTALITIYNRTQTDLRPMGMLRGEHGWVNDCVFQEIDIETGELLFQWAALDHVRPERTFYSHPFAGFLKSVPFDYFHINSIEKDDRGNFLISSRHFHTLSYLNGSSGEILWELGGDATDFTDLSSGEASAFKWQHHARWHSREEGLITLFDNGVAGPLHVDAPTSRGILLQVDESNMTATHIQTFNPSKNVLSSSQGSVQTLPDGRFFIGWGSSAMWSEHAADGALQCEVHFSAAIVYAWEWVKSYRAFKAWGWVGRPTYPPAARISTASPDEIYVSWNGATEVRRWQLQGRRVDAEGKHDFEIISEVEKLGFETSLQLPRLGDYRRYRIAALDAEGETMEFSNLVEPVLRGSSVWGVLFGIGFAFVLLVATFKLCKLWRRRAESGHCPGIVDLDAAGGLLGGAPAAGVGVAIAGDGDERDWAGFASAWKPGNLLHWSRVQYRYSKL